MIMMSNNNDNQINYNDDNHNSSNIHKYGSTSKLSQRSASFARARPALAGLARRARVERVLRK